MKNIENIIFIFNINEKKIINIIIDIEYIFDLKYNFIIIKFLKNKKYEI